MPKKISLESAGITTDGLQMDNGESRFYFKMQDDSAYIRTEAGEAGAWQNAHFHKGVRETYIVQAGWMAFAVLSPDGDYTLQIYEAGRVVSSQPGEHHNVYLPVDAVIHTVKHSDVIGNPDKEDGADWYDADESFDSWTKQVSEEYMRELSDAFGALFGQCVELDEEVLRIVAIGNPNPRWVNQPSSCPVRFDDGTCGVVCDWTVGPQLITSMRDGWNEAIRNSTVMPVVGATGSDVINVVVIDSEGRKGRLRKFFNDKADREDEISWKEPEAA